MIIRNASGSDFEDFFSLQKEFYELEKILSKVDPLVREFCSPPNKKEQKKRFLKWLNKKDGIFLVAEDNNQISGYLYAFLKNLEPLKLQSCHICDIIVLEKFRNKGIATKLHEALVKELKKRGIEWMTLYVSPHNDKAIKLYEKWGYAQNSLRMLKKIK